MCDTTNGMKDVLTDLHKDIVHEDANNGTFNHLLDGGVGLEIIHEIISIIFFNLSRFTELHI